MTSVRALPGFAALMAVEKRGAFDRYCIQVTRAVLHVNDHNVIASRCNRNEIRVGNAITLPTCRVNFVRHERHGAIEFTNGFNDHGKRIIAGGQIIKLCKTRESLPCDLRSTISESKRTLNRYEKHHSTKFFKTCSGGQRGVP